ncbi:MAG TPA: amidohydrolase family protein [Candidatus Thermoplasmatota archaeon]|nr:amidohydrolase family protein [Candidatus Thermoplasmatota archaeon]
MRYAEGEILTEEGFITGYLSFDQHTGLEIGSGKAPKAPFVRGVITPTFINAHTHIGDSFIRTKHLTLPRDVKALVAPPDGLKHKLLGEATEEEIVKGMRVALQEMTAVGTSHFCDFREGGVAGVLQLRTALRNRQIQPLIFSRPATMTYNKEEIHQLLQSSSGIGVSGISDWHYDDLERIARQTKAQRKVFALHASETTREDIDAILDLRPDVLVHMIAASEADLVRVKQEQIPVVLCPRSYAFYQLKTNFEFMKKHRLTLLLGTDNAMINTANILEEVRLLRTTNLFSMEELLTMVTFTPRKALNLEDGIQGLNLLKHFVVLETESLKPVYVS